MNIHYFVYIFVLFSMLNYSELFRVVLEMVLKTIVQATRRRKALGGVGGVAARLVSKGISKAGKNHHAVKSGALIKSGGSVKANVVNAAKQLRPSSVAGNKLLRFKPGADSSNYANMIRR